MPTIQLKSARTAKAGASEAADDLLSQLGGMTPKLVTLFASDDRNVILRLTGDGASRAADAARRIS